MSSPFDVSTLFERIFGSVIDEIAPGWSGSLGFTEDGPNTIFAMMGFGEPLSEKEMEAKAARHREHQEIKRKLAPVIDALRESAVVLVDVEGRAVPVWIWWDGGWTFHRDNQLRKEWLEARTEAGQKVKYFTRKLARPGAQGPKRSAGRKPVDDSADLAAAWKLVVAGKGEHAAAQEVAWKRYSGKTDDNRCINLARRLYGKLRKPADGS